MYILFADLEQQITSLGIKTVMYASLILGVTTLLAILLKKKKALKLPLFLVMALTLIGTTLLLFGSTIYLNIKSESGGPVHWHTDVEFWACGAELELRDPHGLLSNKIGTSTYHEHDDKRIHLEGVVVRKAEDASLEKFMRVSGGYLADDRIGVPLNKLPSDTAIVDASSYWLATDKNDKLDGDQQRPENFLMATSNHEWIQESKDGPVLALTNGNGCGGQAAEVQAFLYTYNEDDDTYSQRKLGSPMDYIMRDEPVVPPGDCLIIEYDQPKERTAKLCKQYGVRDSKRCVEFGVKAYDPGVCNIREVSGGNE